MMSGGPGLNFNTKSDLVANNTAAIARDAGCADGSDNQSEQVLECLRQAPMSKLANLSVSLMRKSRPPFGEGLFYPTYDGDYVADRPSILMRKRQFVKSVPIIASWVTNDGAWYASPTTSSDEEVLNSFGLWLFGLSNATKTKLLDLYPVSDFQHLVRPEYDGLMISPQYYRAAQMNKDLWFTCPVLDFAWEYVKNSNSKLWLYEHNATRYTPVFEMMGVPMWRVAHLSDIPYVFNTHAVRAGADNSEPQLELGEVLSHSIVKFVNTGAPAGEASGMSAWPPAFEDVRRTFLSSQFPSRFTLEIFGRYPGGAQPVTIGRKMGRDQMSDAQQAIAWEKLFERCDFINSPRVREEIGV